MRPMWLLGLNSVLSSRTEKFREGFFFCVESMYLYAVTVVDYVLLKYTAVVLLLYPILVWELNEGCVRNALYPIDVLWRGRSNSINN